MGARDHHSDAEHGRILVADGDAAARSAISWFLVSQGLRVDAVSNGFDAAAALQRSQPPGLAIIDLGLQGFSGRRLIEHLRASDRLAHLPIIAIAEVGPFVPLPPGVVFLRKPVDGESLLRAIESLDHHELDRFFPSRRGRPGGPSGASTDAAAASADGSGQRGLSNRHP